MPAIPATLEAEHPGFNPSTAKTNYKQTEGLAGLPPAPLTPISSPCALPQNQVLCPLLLTFHLSFPATPTQKNTPLVTSIPHVHPHNSSPSG